MNKALKQFLLFLGLVIFIQLLSSPFQNIGDYIYQTLKSNLASFNIEINANEARFRLPAKLILPKSEIKIKQRYVILNDLNLSLSILKLLQLKRSINLAANLFNGTAKINLIQALLIQNFLDIAAEIENMDIGSMLDDKRFVGSFSTKLNASLPIIKGIIDFKHNIAGDIKIRNGSYIGGDNIAGLMILPAAREIKVDLDLESKKSHYKLERISFSSNLGLVSGYAEFELGPDPRFPKTVDLELEIDLTDEGANFFSDYLKLSSKTPTVEKHKKWKLIAKKAQNELFPRFESQPL